LAAPSVALCDSAYFASKGLSPFCRQSFGMTSRFCSPSSLLRAAIAPPVIFPLSVLIIARNGFMPVKPLVPFFILIKPQYSNATPTKCFGTFVHRNLTESGSSSPAVKPSARMDFSAAVSSRICGAGAGVIGSSIADGAAGSGGTDPHPAHQDASNATNKMRVAVSEIGGGNNNEAGDRFPSGIPRDTQIVRETPDFECVHPISFCRASGLARKPVRRSFWDQRPLTSQRIP
jgi:hypothetical protein